MPQNMFLKQINATRTSGLVNDELKSLSHQQKLQVFATTKKELFYQNLEKRRRVQTEVHERFNELRQSILEFPSGRHVHQNSHLLAVWCHLVRQRHNSTN